jgi:DNA polymerase elongation subunit (family B)
MPFTDLIDWQYVQNFSWIKSSIASLIYKSACFAIGVEPTYGETKGKLEEMGGRVLLPKYEEITDVWYIDFASLYPHIFCMFNL